MQALLTDIGTEELGHLEMIAAIVHQLTRNLTDDQIQNNPGFASYFVDHTAGVYPTAASGFPWSAASIGVKGDPICDLTEDMAAEQKARVTYDNILRLAKDDPDVTDVIRFLREREIVHFQRFGSAIQQVREQLDQKKTCIIPTRPSTAEQGGVPPTESKVRPLWDGLCCFHLRNNGHFDDTVSVIFKESVGGLMSFKGKVWVMSGVVSSFPWARSARISGTSQPSTPPVWKVRFFPYISGSGSIWGVSYIATMVTRALGRAHCQARGKVSSPPAASMTTSAPPCSVWDRVRGSTSSGEVTITCG